MKFLVDAQLPRRLALLLQEPGHDAIHTLDLPHGNRTSDAEINVLSLAESRVVITKDSDFMASYILSRQPWKLLLVSVGNINNNSLAELFHTHLDEIVAGLESCDCMELGCREIVYHA